MSAENFASVYKAAIYKTLGLAFCLSDEATDLVLFDGRRFAIVTAYNPSSEQLSAEENQQRHQALERDLKSFSYVAASGESPDGTWVEAGFAVLDIDLEAALPLGKKYGQNAILWGEGGRVYLAWCESGKLEKLYAKQV